MYSFPYLEPVCCSMSGSNCCFLTWIQISQEAGQVIWYFHLLKNFPQFVVIHTVKGFGVVNKAEIDIFLELSCFFDNPTDVGNFISDSSAFSPSLLKQILWCCSENAHILTRSTLNISQSGSQAIFRFLASFCWTASARTKHLISITHAAILTGLKFEFVSVVLKKALTPFCLI